MRTLFIVIVIGALVYLGWVYRAELTGQLKSVTGPGATPAAEEAVAPGAAPAAQQPVAPAATPAPKEMAPPGSFYVKERVSLELPEGIKALNPGELVKVVYRNKDGTVRVSTGKADMTIKESLLTADPDQIKK